MPDIPYPPQRPRPATPSCGHGDYPRGAVVKAVKPAGDTTSDTHTFVAALAHRRPGEN